MNNEITYTRDGLSQDDCNIPALSEKYYLLSPEQLSDIVVRLGVYAKDSPVDVCNNKTFTFSVSVDGETVGEGSGRTKKEAEQTAARRALEKLEA